jgi:TnpA family transposase
VRTGAASASLILKRLGAYPRQNGLALALREIGRIERTLFMLDWIELPDLRRQTTAELNKGEARNALVPSSACRFLHQRCAPPRRLQPWATLSP